MDTAVGSTFTKMKGVGYTNVSGLETVWDVSDYVFPEQVGDWLGVYPEQGGDWLGVLPEQGGDWLGTRIHMWNVRGKMVYVAETDGTTEQNTRLLTSLTDS